MSKWKQRSDKPSFVITKGGVLIASCYEIKHAEQIVREHNSHEALLAVCKLAVKDAERASQPRSRLAYYGAFVATIALAEGTP